MSEQGKSKEQAARTKRQADALRENLRRRKLQARSRGAAPGTVQEGRTEGQSGPDGSKR